MRKKEQRLWDTARRNAPAHFWLQRIENIVGEGIPDVYAVTNGYASWVELKAPNRPAKASTRLLGTEGLRTGQISWHLKAASKELPSFILIRDDTAELFLIEGKHADKINDWTVDQMRKENLATTWEEIYLVLDRFELN